MDERVSETLIQVQALVARGSIHISDHGYDELANDDIFIREVLTSVSTAMVVEDYPSATRGPSVLVLQKKCLATACSCGVGNSAGIFQTCGDCIST
jgi:hypothetical protein